MSKIAVYNRPGPPGYDELINRSQKQWWRSTGQAAAALVVVAVCAHYVGLLDLERLADGVPSILSLMLESLPPGLLRRGQLAETPVGQPWP